VAPLIEKNALVLFQGDSITDAGRDRGDPASMGTGYAYMVSAWCSAAHPERHARFLNRGISGNRVKNLEARWQEDCLDLAPSWVSIMIGINDTWRAFDSGDPTSSGAYESSYRAIPEPVRDRLGARRVLMEPFVLPFPEDQTSWRADLDPRIEIVHRLAEEFGAVLVPMDAVINEAAERRDPATWAPDGVHPTPAGHALIAQSWLRAVGA
jgi:lysophospholipase L1-like esterase